MGLDLSVYKVEKVNEVPFILIYNAVDDETLKRFLEENERYKNADIEYYQKDDFYTGKFLERQIARIEKQYDRYAENAIQLNARYSALSQTDKEAIAKLSSVEHQYYGKNWDLFGLLGHELCGEVFDHDTQSPIANLNKETLEKVFKLTQKENPENAGLSHLQSLLSKGDFDKYHYFIEAWY